MQECSPGKVEENFLRTQNIIENPKAKFLPVPFQTVLLSSPQRKPTAFITIASDNKINADF